MPARTRDRLRSKTPLLAGTLVLALGALAALAWPRAGQAQADARFGTDGFVVEVRTHEGAAWREAREGVKAARLNFAVAVAGLQPGSTVYAPISLRTDERSTSGTVTLEPAINRGNGTLFSSLEYGVAQLADESDCGPGAETDAALVEPGSALDTQDTGSLQLAAHGQDEVDLCFAVTLPAGDTASLAELETTIQWQFTATGSAPDGSGTD